MPPLFVTVGGTMVDWIVNAVGEEHRTCCGGNAFYSAVGAHFWSDSVAVVSRIGLNYPPEYLEAFRQAGIQIHTVRIPYAHSSPRPVYYDEIGRRFGHSKNRMKHKKFPYPGKRVTPFDADPLDVPSEFWQAKAFHIAPMPQPSQYAFAQALDERSIPFSLDPRNNILDNTYIELLQLTTYFLPSEDEITNLIAGSSFEDKVQKICTLGPKIVVVKLGRQGALVLDKRTQTRMEIPAYPSEIKDPTGAGDAFCGGFITGMIETQNVLEAALRGTVSASIVIEEFDARFGLQVSPLEIQRRYRYLKQMVIEG